MNRSIKWKDKTIGFCDLPDGSQFVQARQRIDEMDICSICKKYFQAHNTTSVVLIISNQAGIPNRFVHSECMEGKTDEEVFALIAKHWEKVQKYKGWF